MGTVKSDRIAKSSKYRTTNYRGFWVCWGNFKGHENFIQIGKSSNYTEFTVVVIRPAAFPSVLGKIRSHVLHGRMAVGLTKEHYQLVTIDSLTLNSIYLGYII